jgi:hypothetical protein
MALGAGGMTWRGGGRGAACTGAGAGGIIAFGAVGGAMDTGASFVSAVDTATAG